MSISRAREREGKEGGTERERAAVGADVKTRQDKKTLDPLDTRSSRN
jgi:hypothetical protein